MTVPKPWQVAHGAAVTTVPRIDWTWRWTCPEPWQTSQVSGRVPSWQQEPSQVGQTTAVSTVIFFSVPKTASLRETRTLISASWPWRVRDAGPRRPEPAPPAPWKNVSKMSAKPKPVPGKPPPKPVSVPFSLPVAS
jgi:hypothetical protein